MKKLLLYGFLGAALLFGFERLAETQKKSENAQPEDDKNKPKMIVLNGGEPKALLYDGGAARFLVDSEDTNGAWSLVELAESPGYHTNLHRHNRTDEAFYVLEGTLTGNIKGEISDYPAGSYVLIPRGTPHAQGNAGKVPVKVLLTMTPGGFERSFKDRVELFKMVKPDDKDFRKKRVENKVKGNYDVEKLEDWNLPQ
jgi:mannose-6-phosphate isomerase-like protein (cupin superfamily)